MPNFSVHYSFERNQVIFHKLAVVRATTPNAAKDKIVDYYLNRFGTLSSITFEKISLSNYNLILS